VSEEKDDKYYESLVDVILDDALQILSAHVRALKEIGLTEKTIIILLHHYTSIPKTQIKEVLDALDELADDKGEES